jgi:hypothetical protein
MMGEVLRDFPPFLLDNRPKIVDIVETFPTCLNRTNINISDI